MSNWRGVYRDLRDPALGEHRWRRPSAFLVATGLWARWPFARLFPAADVRLPEPRPTTSESARALEAATAPDPQPRTPELYADDGFDV